MHAACKRKINKLRSFRFQRRHLKTMLLFALFTTGIIDITKQNRNEVQIESSISKTENAKRRSLLVKSIIFCAVSVNLNSGL